MIKLTVKQLQKTIDSIIDDYSDGDDTIYLVSHEKGDVVLKPYDGPYTCEVKKKHNEYYVDIPKRLLSKLGWVEGDSINMESKNGGIYLNKIK